MNKFIGIGRLTKDTELRYTTSNVAVAQFSLAVNRDFKNQQGEYEADFINCVAYRKLAETIAEYVRKGDRIAVEGRLQVRNYDNSEGKKIYITEVVVDGIDFLEAKKKDATDNNVVDKEEHKQESDPFADFGASIEISDDDLPF